jgi:hypothetical protein
MAVDFVGWQEVYIAPGKYKNRHNQEKRLPTGAKEEGVAAEERITRDETFADKPTLT